MKVLWFSITPALYKGQKATAGTWIESLLNVIKGNRDIELGISFCTTEKKCEETLIDGIHYYPIYRSTFCTKVIDKMTCKYENRQIIQDGLKIIDNFKPDLIHIFGSEWCFGLLKYHTNVPIVIHMQGCWPAIRLAGGTLREQFAKELVRKWYNPLYLTGRRWTFHKSFERAKREEEIISINSNFMGRTKWDKALVNLFSPKSTYYHCEEALRPEFMSGDKWKFQQHNKLRFVTIGGNSNLKGYKLALLTAHILKEHTNIDFEWKIIGTNNSFLKKFEYETGYRFKDNNFDILGYLLADKIKEVLLSSDLFIHTSCIDNSPNAICEAQLLGLPIISTNVGGISSLFPSDYPSDYLVAPNDPYYLASRIISLANDKELQIEMGEKNFQFSHNRNDGEHIKKQLFDIYNDITTKASK